jgi:hypothetical protein
VPQPLVSDYVVSQLGLVVALSIIVERALSVVFGARVFVERWSRRSLKEVIAVAVSIGVCIHWDVDVVAALVDGEAGSEQLLGKLLTAGVVAGGSKASLKLFRDVLGIKSKAEQAEPSSPSSPSSPPSPPSPPGS